LKTRFVKNKTPKDIIVLKKSKMFFEYLSSPETKDKKEDISKSIPLKKPTTAIAQKT
jgi:hypothetical protein